MSCTCDHRDLTHRYDTKTRTNSRECLAPGCNCKGDNN